MLFDLKKKFPDYTDIGLDDRFLHIVGPSVQTATYDPPSIAAAASDTTTVSVPGALVGDECYASFSLDLQGLQLTAHVSAADTVTTVLSNLTGGPIDLAEGTLKVWVVKASTV